MIPPLQFILIMMMKLKLIKKGKGGQPYDYFMLIPIILKFAVGFILSGIESPSYQILDVIIETISIMVPFLIRATSNCGQLTFESLFNSFANTTTLQVVIILFNIVIKFIPIVGIFFRITKKIPVVGKILPWIICYSAGYIILNMINGNDLKKYCDSYPKAMNTVLPMLFWLVQNILLLH